MRAVLLNELDEVIDALLVLGKLVAVPWLVVHMLDNLLAADHGRVFSLLVLVVDDDGAAVHILSKARLRRITLQPNLHLLAGILDEEAFLTSGENWRVARALSNLDDLAYILLEDHLPELVHGLFFRFERRDHVAERIIQLFVGVAFVIEVLAEAGLDIVRVEMSLFVFFINMVGPRLDLDSSLC